MSVARNDIARAEGCCDCPRFAAEGEEMGMTDSTWTDSTGNHEAKDPNNWSSGSAPQPGDSLFVPGGSTLDVAGTGVFDDGIAHFGPSPSAAAGGFLEFGGRVSGEQTINVEGSGGAPIGSRLVVDQPHEFHASVHLFFASSVDLVDLAEADHWSYANDVLSISNVGGKVIDQLHVVNEVGTPHGLSVSKTSAGDVLVGLGVDFSGSLAAPTT